MKVLFIGNSHTYFNDMPALFRAVCGQHGIDVHVTMLTKGGMGLDYHLRQEQTLFNIRYGGFANIWHLFSDGKVPDLLSSATAFTHMYVWSGVWQGMGWGSIIYMAALSNVDETLHEAAMIDGASRLQRIFCIDFPAIIPTITITLILRCGHLMGIGFDKVYLMQNNLNLRASEVISTYVYKVGLASTTSDFSYSTAISLFNSVVNLILLLIVNTVSRKVGETSLW